MIVTKTILTVAILLSVIPCFGSSSYYSARIYDAKAVYLTSDNFPVKADGVADDTNSIQQAINRVQETQGQGIVFVPSGRYRLTKTIYIWPGIRVIGYGATRPAFVLGANTTGFQKGARLHGFLCGCSSRVHRQVPPSA